MIFVALRSGWATAAAVKGRISRDRGAVRSDRYGAERNQYDLQPAPSYHYKRVPIIKQGSVCSGVFKSGKIWA